MNLKKDLAIVSGLFLLIVALLIFGKGFTSTSFVGLGNQESTREAQFSSPKLQRQDNKINFSVKNLNILVDVAKTKDERKKGLSGKDEMPIGEGMLFVFEESQKQAIWMKDMKFAIDIIWIDSNKKIVDIASNAVPEPGKDDGELKRYQPKAAALYILEINAGLVALNKLEIGDQVEFKL